MSARLTAVRERLRATRRTTPVAVPAAVLETGAGDRGMTRHPKLARPIQSTDTRYPGGTVVATVVNLTVHGIGPTPRTLDPGEDPTWATVEQFEQVLDAVVAAPTCG